MTVIERETEAPLGAWTGRFESWLTDRCCPARARRAVLSFGRLSSWLEGRGVLLADVTEDVIDEYVRAEQVRSGSAIPAAAQYLPLAKRFLASEEIVTLRGPASRHRHGIPRQPAGALAEVIAHLVEWLRAEGYAPGTAVAVACTAARLGAWMAEAGLSVHDLDDALLERFVAAERRGPRQHPSSTRRIVTVRKYFTAAGLLATRPPTTAAALTPTEQVLEAWAAERVAHGIAPGWLREQNGWARRLLEQVVDGGTVRWEQVTVSTANDYVRARGRGYSLSSKRHLVSTVRSLLRWAFRTGRLDRDLSAGVFGPSRRSLAGLPRALTARQLETLKSAADTDTAMGRRDRAIVVMISRLGLRASEVAGLTLGDIDWRHAQLRVRGKGDRTRVLPLPADVGETLVAYLRHGCPGDVRERAVFVRSRPPLRALTGGGISGVVASLARRAGLGVVHAHRLRHTAATAVIAGGGSLVEARELLGHARTDTTMIYARTDLHALSALVTPWGAVPR